MSGSPRAASIGRAAARRTIFARAHGGEADSSRGALAPVSRRRVRALTIAALGLLAALNGADDVTTRLLVDRRAVEANPLAGILFGNGTLLWVKLGIVALLGIAVLRLPAKVGVLLLSWFVAGLYAAAVLSNVLILRLT